MSNWAFSIRLLNDSYVVLSLDKGNKKHEITLTIKEYTEFMELAQTFNMQFETQINNALLQHYLNG